MKTNIRKDINGVTIDIAGTLNFETTDSFREQLNRISSQFEGQQITFNLGGLEFVGSSGISAFIHALREFNSRSDLKPRYLNVRSEFKKIIRAFDTDGSFDIWESNDRALKSFDN